jgi:trimeric autotransporter adhesin
MLDFVKGILNLEDRIGKEQRTRFRPCGRKGVEEKMRLTVAFLLLLIPVSCGGGSSSSSNLLTYISVTPADPSVPAGATKQFSAAGINSDGSNHDLAGNVTWSSSDPAVATINSSGLATALATGTTAITATSGNISGSTTLKVYSATLSFISVTMPDASIPAGISQQAVATGTYSDGTSHDISTRVIWSSSDSSAATVDSGGLAKAISPGSAVITVTSGSVSATVALTVNPATLSFISVTPLIPSIPVGMNEQLMATATYSNGTCFDVTKQIRWSSSDPSVAAIGENGLITAIAPGTVTITAGSGSIWERTTVTINPGP